MNYTVEVEKTKFTREYPNFPLAHATVRVHEGPLAGLRMDGYRVYIINGELRVVYAAMPDYVLSQELHDQILDCYRRLP